MGNEPRPIRSVVLVPGHREDLIREVGTYGPDALVLDLEDTCPPAHRPQARQLAYKLLQELATQDKTLFVRPNAIDTSETGDDLEAAVCPQLHGIFLPKVTGPKDMIAVSALLDFFEHPQDE